MASAFHQKPTGCGSFVQWVQPIVINRDKWGRGIRYSCIGDQTIVTIPPSYKVLCYWGLYACCQLTFV